MKKNTSNNADQTLLVVDMQAGMCQDNQTLENVLAEVLAARAAGKPIIFLEISHDELEPHLPYARSFDCLLNCIEGYEHGHVVTRVGKRLAVEKAGWTRPRVPGEDGSKGVLKLCKDRGYAQSRFRVCGVQADMCVLATVRGLLKRSSCRIELVEKACHTSSGFKFWRFKYPEGPRLKLV